MDGSDPRVGLSHTALIYHITRLEHYRVHAYPFSSEDVIALPSRPFSSPDLSSTGFIHFCANLGALLHVANTFYAEAKGVFVVIEVRTDLLKSEVKWEAPVHVKDVMENAKPKGLMPHVYGTVNPEAVVAVWKAKRDEQGNFVSARSPTDDKA